MYVLRSCILNVGTHIKEDNRKTLASKVKICFILPLDFTALPRSGIERYDIPRKLLIWEAGVTRGGYCSVLRCNQGGCDVTRDRSEGRLV